MKICVFSDLHGNQYAFRSFIDIAKKQNPDLYIFLGDIFGYYYGQKEIVEKLCAIPNLIWLRGNHDKYYLDILDRHLQPDILIEKYGHSYANINSCLSYAYQTIIRNLSPEKELTLENERILLCHGTQEDTQNGRLYPKDLPLEYNFNGYDIIIQGHTHFRIAKFYDKKLILNPGSLGQPRDKNKAGFAILTLPEKKVTFIDVDYDRDTLEKEIREHDPDNIKLIELLHRYD